MVLCILCVRACVQECDEPVLEHLTDIKVVYADMKGLVSGSNLIYSAVLRWTLTCYQDFTLEYHFSENEYFTNKVLTKSYTVSCDVDDESPFSYEGAFITEGKG